MTDRRAAARTLCEAFLPETNNRSAFIHWGQVGFDHIAKNYGEGSGTTCGFLPHWMLWRLGCRDATLVNRAEPDEGLTYLIQQNLSIFQPLGGKNVRPAWVSLDTAAKNAAAAKGEGPRCGDIVIIRGRNWKNKAGERALDSAHIFVLLDVLKADGKKVEWRIAQTGQNTDGGKQAGQITTIKGELRDGAFEQGGAGEKPNPGPCLVFTANILGEEADFPRRVLGYTDLSGLSWGAEPDLSFCRLFERRRDEPAENNAGKIYEWRGWYQLDDMPGFVKLAPTFILFDNGHEAFRLERRTLGPHLCTAGGLWTRSGATLSVEWDDGSPAQSWVVTKTWVPREKTTGVPVAGTVGGLIRLPKVPPELPPRWLSA